MAKRQISGGNFQSSDGNPLVAGYLTFRLLTDGYAGTIQVSAGIKVTVPLDSTGNVVGTPALWPNASLTPVSVYQVDAFTVSGEKVWSNQMTIPAGGGSFDLGGWIPSNT
jgi:hypothetical protein